ncbi:MFS transporter [Nocardia macrotermitis]|uniref:Sugar efflux transporter n=1 Tax=Nocardia macrotermitis TaxID=2585198 RepID=A0A7K0D767_9NOCA|nr:MFS transporter [Nocardia macrotermitis]MQY20704.1 sugar efflux transporter [Nocardia macrotermitis]
MNFLIPLLALGAATFTTVSAEMMPAGVLDAMSSSLSVDVSTAGLLVTGWAGTIAVTGIPLVRLTMRWSRKSVILASLGVMAVANLATALAPTYAIALLARMVAAGAHGLFWAVVVAYGASLVPPERVGRALSIVLAGPTVAGLVGVPLGTQVAHQVGWRVSFAGLAVLCVVCAAVIAMLVPQVGGGARPESERWDRSARSVLLVAGGGFFSLIGYYSVFTFVVPVSGAAGIGAGAVSGVLLASGVGGFAGVLVAGRIGDRWPTASLPLTALALAVVTAGMGLSSGAIVYVVLVTLWGVLIGILPVVLQARVMRVASERFRNTAGSILITVLNLGIGLGAGLGSLTSALDLLRYLPVSAAAVALLALVPFALLRSEPRERSDERDPRPVEEVLQGCDTSG